MRQLALKIAIIIVLTSALVGCGTRPVVSPSPTVPTPAVSVPPSPFVQVGIKVGDVAPEFRLPDLNGKIVTLSQFKGRAIFINVWSFN
jgi:hypothetical protein